ncbi:hypothetical protein JCM9140_2004 [Halalkalibacter wakoensis JCM 9140]|uniref:Histidine kinase/HSP90-like ATPase domain-containing protein n=1 Tax=Halalkalibacter wakoensis JCM 9140 TaxID=1236970 RepID=W4Q3Q2_9BACI|nr:ATP-binding protein [Halalkalibacter wakoensis]GAE25979.1 hypothetical protein JCM9140_2004 [Halalkalibacter wakoensis JCM 9140]
MLEKEIVNKDDIYDAMKYTEKLAEKAGFSYDVVLKLQLVTEEACMNAFEYCQSRKIASFHLLWNIQKDFFEMIVKQKGGYFTLVEKSAVNKELRGRGLTLIMNLLDRVEVKQESEYVTLYMRKEKN